MKKIHLITFALGLIAGPVGLAEAQRLARAGGIISIPVEEPADSLYRLGRQAIADRDYRRAANLLRQVTDKYPSAKNAGDALYWRAWALHRLGADRRDERDLDDALEAISRLEKEYPKAATISDARTLRGTIRSAQASLGDAGAARDIADRAKGLSQQRSCTGSRADEEMRVAALEGLLQMNSADAVPILQDVLKQRDPCRIELRKKAVWLITQKRGVDIVPTLLDVARSDPSNDVRGEAIFWLSQARSEQAIPALDSVLFSAGDDEIRKKAIFSLSQQRDERARAAIRRAAEDTRMSDEIRGEAIFWLGNAKLVDLDYFKTLFQKTRETELRKKVIFAVQQLPGPDAATWLLDLAKNRAYDTETRKDAIFWLSQRRSIDLDALQSIYDGAKDEQEIQKQVIFVYTQRREPAAVDKLMDIAKTDPRIENRKDALFWLGQKNDPRVRQFLRDLINK